VYVKTPPVMACWGEQSSLVIDANRVLPVLLHCIYQATSAANRHGWAPLVAWLPLGRCCLGLWAQEAKATTGHFQCRSTQQHSFIPSR
ncbi:uncharacterized protein PgNI_00755, partial [Pyricularia grisea]|uniref:Uncharacterized protein n=1 Tax=Pyricularia grisea TaxID=148305 RepID=A0A6P8BGD4_PYRGI